MKRIRHSWTACVTTVVVPLLLAAPANTSAGQVRNRNGGDGGSQAVPRGAPASSPDPAPAPAPAPASAPAVAPAPAPNSAGTQATPRSIPGTGSTAPGNSGARPREGRAPAGTAVPRESVSPRTGTTTVVVPVPHDGGFSSWGSGGLGLGRYYGGFYDPYGPWYGGYLYSPSSVTIGFEGSLRLKIKPRDAQVFVDGYYAGVVDDYDGIFQRLNLEMGAHHIEVEEQGYPPMEFDVRIEPGQTITIRGDIP